jgi:hypothetical protein
MSIYIQRCVCTVYIDFVSFGCHNRHYRWHGGAKPQKDVSGQKWPKSMDDEMIVLAWVGNGMMMTMGAGRWFQCARVCKNVHCRLYAELLFCRIGRGIQIDGVVWHLSVMKKKECVSGGIWTHECEHSRTWVYPLGPLGHADVIQGYNTQNGYKTKQLPPPINIPRTRSNTTQPLHNTPWIYTSRSSTISTWHITYWETRIRRNHTIARRHRGYTTNRYIILCSYPTHACLTTNVFNL